MKKFYMLIIVSILVIFTTSCGGTTSVESLDFPISDNMKLETTKENEVDKENVELSTYSVQDGDINSFLFEYEETLNDKGWKTVSNLKPRGLTVEKNDRQVTIIVYEENDALLVDIIPTPKAKE